jgi:hypothetical protein
MPEPAISARILHGDQVWQPRYPLGTAAGKRSIDVMDGARSRQRSAIG